MSEKSLQSNEVPNRSHYQLEDSFWPRWVKGLVLLGFVMFAVYLAAHMYAWRLHGLPIRIGSIYLRNLHRAWQKDGSPKNPIITNYVVSTSDRYFVWTNQYSFKLGPFESQFALETSQFGGRGFLIISRDGRLAWIDNKTGPELIKQ